MPRYRIVVDRERCVGDGLCRERADGTFDIDKELRCAVRDAKGSSPEDVLFAAWGCANGCIALYDEETGGISAAAIERRPLLRDRPPVPVTRPFPFDLLSLGLLVCLHAA
jgi:ferredoxin